MGWPKILSHETYECRQFRCSSAPTPKPQAGRYDLQRAPHVVIKRWQRDDSAYFRFHRLVLLIMLAYSSIALQG